MSAAKKYFDEQYRLAVEKQKLLEFRGLVEPGESWIGLDMKLFLDTNAPTPQITPGASTPGVSTPSKNTNESKPPSPLRRLFSSTKESNPPSPKRTDVVIEMKPPSPRLQTFTESKGCTF